MFMWIRKIWFVAQYINMTRIPVQYRTIFGSLVGLLWNIMLALSQAT